MESFQILGRGTVTSRTAGTVKAGRVAKEAQAGDAGVQAGEPVTVATGAVSPQNDAPLAPVVDAPLVGPFLAEGLLGLVLTLVRIRGLILPADLYAQRDHILGTL